MKFPLLSSRLSLRNKLLIGFALAAVVVIVLFDWNWLRGPLVWYVSERSGRDIRVEALEVDRLLTLEPTVTFRGARIANAPWAATHVQPMAVAREARFTFSLKTAWQRRVVVSRLVLVDADVVLERREDGLRNWRLFEPDAHRPGLFRILTLEAHRSRIRFVHGGQALDVVAASNAPEPGAAAPVDGESLSNRIEFKGTYRGTAFSGVAHTGPFVSFRHSGRQFPIRGRAAAGETRLEVEGHLADFLELGTIAAGVRVAGPTLARLHPFLPIHPSASRPYEIEAWVRKADDDYAFERLRGRIGGTKLAGEAGYRRGDERPFVRAMLKSDNADWSDLRPLLGLDAEAGNEPLTQRHLHGDRLKAIDARIRVEASKLKTAIIPALEGLNVTVKLDGGLLELNPLEARFAGGRVAGSLTFDGRRTPLASAARLAMSDIRLERIFSTLPPAARGLGPVRARIRLSGQGDSLGSMLGRSTGTVGAFSSGGTISNLADARIGLNLAKIFGLMLRGDRPIAVNCGAMVFDVRDGQGKSETLFLDTEQTRTRGSGTVDLGDQTFDLLLTPAPKKPALFAMQKSIRVQGSFESAGVTLVDRQRLDGKTENGDGDRCAQLAASVDHSAR